MLAEVFKDIDLTLLKGFMDGIRPDARMTVSEWADSKRILPETSAEPGKFRTSRTPYAKEIMDKLSIMDPAQKIVLISGSQVGKTEIGNNWVGYSIDIAPAPFIYIMPTDAMMKKTSKQRIEKMIESTPELNSKVAKPRAKDSGNTLLYKEFPGGFITMVGANSPVGLASTPARFIYADEIDRYPESVGGEGSAVGLAETRTSTFGNRRKMFLTSTPTLKGISQIDAEFEKTGQRYFHVPCPLCNEYHVLQFLNLKYEVGKYQETKYECPACKGLIDERFKTKMLSAGIWKPKYPDKEDGFVWGYHLSAMYSPYGMFSWSRMAKEYEDAKGNIPKQIVFVNTKLGECYEAVQGDKPDWEGLYERAEDYPPNKPYKSVAFITAGVDVQADRLEIEIVGWIKGKTSQSLDYRIIVGDTNKDEVWAELTKIINEIWVREDNALLSLKYMAIDTGYNTEKVYQFTQKHSINRVIPVKGRESLQMFYSSPQAIEVVKSGKKLGRVKVWGVGVSMIKSEVYGFLKLQVDHESGEVPNGFCFFPKREPSYFRGLTAEEHVLTQNKKGYDIYEWRKKYKRNEPLDCRVYARAAASMAGMDRWTDKQWEDEANRWEIQQAEQLKQKTDNKKPNKSPFWNR